MQTLNLILPMAGSGKRFVKKNYKTYKTLLNVDNNITIYDKLISNFKIKKIKIIVILNREIYFKFNHKFNKKNVKLIFIENHNSGPLYTLHKVNLELNKIIKKNESFFICYGDINWKWDLKKVLNFFKNKDACVFTHRGFHPHLEVNSKSDFCKVKNNYKNTPEKKLVKIIKRSFGYYVIILVISTLVDFSTKKFYSKQKNIIYYL